MVKGDVDANDLLLLVVEKTVNAHTNANTFYPQFIVETKENLE